MKNNLNDTKILFFSPALRVNKIFLRPYRSKIFPESVRASKTLQFGHQFFKDWSIQSCGIVKNVKNVQITPRFHAAKKTSQALFLKLSQI